MRYPTLFVLVRAWSRLGKPSQNVSLNNRQKGIGTCLVIYYLLNWNRLYDGEMVKEFYHYIEWHMFVNSVTTMPIFHLPWWGFCSWRLFHINISLLIEFLFLLVPLVFSFTLFLFNLNNRTGIYIYLVTHCLCILKFDTVQKKSKF